MPRREVAVLAIWECRLVSCRSFVLRLGTGDLARWAVEEVVLAEGDEVGGDPAHEDPTGKRPKRGQQTHEPLSLGDGEPRGRFLGGHRGEGVDDEEIP